MHVLLDDRSGVPLRDVLGSLLASARRAAIAISRIRLRAIDLAAAETGRVVDCRIILGRLDTRGLAGLAAHDQATVRNLQLVHAFLTSGRVRIHSAGMHDWLPDFSVYEELRDGGAACVVGAHYFRDPPVDAGPALTCVLADATAVRRARLRFDELWERTHDVLPAIVAAVESGIGTDPR
jgi:hypothetical protein